MVEPRRLPLFALLVACLVVASCTSAAPRAEQNQPAEPLAEPTDVPDNTPPTDAIAVPSPQEQEVEPQPMPLDMASELAQRDQRLGGRPVFDVLGDWFSGTGTMVRFSDHRAAAMQAGIVPDCSTPGRRDAYMKAIFEEGGTLLPNQWWAVRDGPGSLEDEFGYSVCDITASLVVVDNERWPVVMELATSADSIDAAVRSDPVWSDELRDEESGGFAYYAWGRSGEPNMDRRSFGRTLGRGGQLLADGSVVVRSVFEDELQDAVVARNERDGLSEMPLLVAMIELLDQDDPHSFLVTTAQSYEKHPTEPMLAPFVLLAAGFHIDDGETVTTVVIGHQTAAQAEENAARLEKVLTTGSEWFAGERLWADYFAEPITIRTEGSIVVASNFTRPDPYGWQIGLLSASSSLFLVEAE